MNFWLLITDIGVLLATSLILGTILLRMGISPLVGYLIAGMCLGGPGSLNFIKSAVEIEAISELGVSLLLFSLGLEFSWNKIRAFHKTTVLAGILQILISPLIIAGFCLLFKLNVSQAITVGMIFTLSSTASVLRILVDSADLDSVHGRNSIAILLLQDIAVVPFAIIISLLNTHQHGVSVEMIKDIATTLGGAVLLIIGLYIILLKVAVRFFGVFTHEQNREMAIILAVVTGIGSAWSSHAIGLSPALGAFIAGMFLGGSRYATQIRADIAPLRIVLLTLFFSSAGMVADPLWIIKHADTVLSTTLSIGLIKAVVIIGIFAGFRQSLAGSIASAICLGQVGEFAFVLARLAHENNLLSFNLYQLALSVTICSLLITPFIVTKAAQIGFFIQNTISKQKILLPTKTKTHQPGGKIFIFGFGPAGQEVALKFKDQTNDLIIIDLNKNAAKKANAFGLKCYLGDVQQQDVLEHYGIRHAQLVIITIPSKYAAALALNNVRQLNADATTIVRARYQLHTQEFLDAGAHFVVNDENVVGRSLADVAMSVHKGEAIVNEQYYR